ncbi:dihydrodipicolinate synthase family protein, partial [Pseudomonas syringae pv. tagetis]
LEAVRCRQANFRQQPALSQEIAMLNELFLLNASDWYAQVKRELKSRGVIDSDRVLAEEAA